MWGQAIVALWVAAFTYVVPFLVKVAASFGIGFVTYTGTDLILTEAENYVMSNFNGLPVDALALVKIAGFYDGIHMVFAGWTAAMAIKVAMGALSKWRSRPFTLEA